MTHNLPPLVQVPDECRPDAKLIVISEAPWRSEAEKGYPLAGWSGLKLRELWQPFGIQREDASILNVYQYPRKPETVKPETMRQWVEHLHKRLAVQTNPSVIVPMGNLALWALTGKGYPPWDKPKKHEFARAGIQKLRGSVLEYRDRLDRRVKVIPTLHPVALSKSPGLEVDCLHDWGKIARELAFKDIRKVARDLRVVEFVEEVEYWVKAWQEGGQPLTFDIENPIGETIMIGFATSRHQGITIPTTKRFWKSEAANEKVWELIKGVLESDIEKVGQVVSYDVETLLRERGIRTRNAIWDTANMFHAWMPTLRSFKLEYLASVFTNEEYWKDECLLGTTEVLTKAGWKPLKDCQATETIAQYDFTNDMVSFTRAKIIQRGFDGELIVASSKQHECAYTPQHRIPEIQRVRRKQQTREYRRERRAVDVVNLKTFNLPTGGKYQSGYKDVAWMRLLVAIQADAALRKGTYAVFTLKKVRKIERLQQLCQEAGAICDEIKAAPGYRCFSVKGPVVRNIAAQFGQKKVFGSWLLDFGPRNLYELLDEVRYWDGSNDTHSAHAWHYYSKERENVEWVATVAALCRHSARLSQDQNGCYKCTIKNRPWTVLQPQHFHGELYTGPVYCTQVPTGFFLMRSQGHIAVTGNSKDPEEARKYTSNMAAFYRYNGLDATVTHELFEVATQLLRRDNLLTFYVQHYGQLADPLLEIAMTGIKVDEAMRQWRWADVMAERFETQDRLEEVVGESLMAEKSLSPVKLKRFLYETLRLPTKYKRVKGKEERSVTTDEVAIRTLMEQHKGCEKLQAAGALILRLRFLDAREKYYKDKVAHNGRMYSKYSPRTEEGRLSSSASNQRTAEGEKIGMNAQNIDREIRDMFVAG